MSTFTDATLTDTAEEGSVRLVGGSTTQKGRVELFLLGQWGTVCSNQWDIADATVVCHQLGYLRAVGAPRYAAFGAGSGPSWYRDVGCVGTEKYLTECSINGELTGTACSHAQDAGVVCSGKPKSHPISFLYSYVQLNCLDHFCCSQYTAC